MTDDVLLRGAVTNNEPDVKETGITSGTFSDAISAASGQKISFHIKNYDELTEDDTEGNKLIMCEKGILFKGWLLALPNDKPVNVTSDIKNLLKQLDSLKITPSLLVTILSRYSEETPDAASNLFKAGNANNETTAQLNVNESRPVNGTYTQMIDLDITKFAKVIADELSPTNFIWTIDRQCIVPEDYRIQNLWLAIPTENVASHSGDIVCTPKEITEFPYTLTNSEVTALKTAYTNGYGGYSALSGAILFELPESPSLSSNMVEFDTSTFILSKYKTRNSLN